MAGQPANLPYCGNARSVTHKVQMVACEAGQASWTGAVSPLPTGAYVWPSRWIPRCTDPSVRTRRFGGLGGTVTVVYTVQSEAPEKTRSVLLPLLVILFIISYSILTLLVVEQGRTIEVQRGLLREMLKDSSQLASLKQKMAREAAAHPQGKAAPQADRQNPAGADTASPEDTTPKASGKEKQHPGKSRTMKEVPERPAADLQDVRRSTRVI